jgi:hypothetical protein
MRLFLGKWRKVLVTTLALWFVLAVGGFAWLHRSSFGLGSSNSKDLALDTAGTSISIVCSLQTPIIVDRETELICNALTFGSLTALPDTTKSIDVGLWVSGDVFKGRIPGKQLTVNPGKPFDFSNSPTVHFDVTPVSSGDHTITLTAAYGTDLSSVPWNISVELRPTEIVLFTLPLALLLTPIFSGVISAAAEFRGAAARAAAVQKRIEVAETKAEQEPAKAKFAWDVARVKLEAYFDRNLSQVNQVFWLAVSVMIIGFGFVLGGVFLALKQPQITTPAIVAGVSGVITEFLGATFLVIYRSTMAQAGEFMWVLERINTVGMAVQILDSIPESQTELKDSTRAEVVALLLNANISSPSKMRVPRRRPEAK